MCVQVTVEECYIDLEENREWRELYQFDIPVVHLNGSFLMKHRIDENKLKKILENKI